MGRRTALASVAVLALTSAGCSALAPFPGDQPVPEDLFQASRDSDAAPAGFDDSVERTACGDVTLSQGEQLASAALDCINAAIGTASADLAVVAPTTEGDPIVTFYRTSPSVEGFVMYVNSTYDRFGSGGWARLTCTGTDVTSLSGCVEG
jgi:hypothetical protein